MKNNIHAPGYKDALQKIRKHLLARRETLAVAESVTSGHVQAALSMADDATQFFQGGITAYNLGQKARHLYVEPIHAEACNCVSEKIACEMALNVCRLFSSTWGMGIAGYAAPVPACDITTLFAHYAIAHQGKIVLAKKVIGKKKIAWAVQQEYTHALLTDLAGLLAVANNHRHNSFGWSRSALNA